MRIGSLFSGIGGLELGLANCGVGPVVWHCERDPYARAVLEHHWPEATVYRDIRRIDETAQPIDLICGGFPCQPHSVAGNRRGTADARWLWPEFARVVGLFHPRVVFLENVPGLRTSGLRVVLADLARLGFDAQWGCFTAAAVGAPHRRERLFVLAYADGLADTACPGLEGQRQGLPRSSGDESGRVHRFPPGPGQIGNWAGPEPAVRRGSHGLSRRVDRLRCLGNAVIPQQAALAWTVLVERAAA